MVAQLADIEDEMPRRRGSLLLATPVSASALLLLLLVACLHGAIAERPGREVAATQQQLTRAAAQQQLFRDHARVSEVRQMHAVAAAFGAIRDAADQGNTTHLSKAMRGIVAQLMGKIEPIIAKKLEEVFCPRRMVQQEEEEEEEMDEAEEEEAHAKKRRGKKGKAHGEKGHGKKEEGTSRHEKTEALWKIDRVTDDEWEAFNLLNKLRADGFTCTSGKTYSPNAEKLKFDCRLWQASRHHSADEGVGNYFSHYAEDGSNFKDRAKKKGVAEPSAENLAAGKSSAADTLMQWKNAAAGSTYCDDMMSSEQKAVGIGRIEVTGSKYTFYWTQIFSKTGDVDTTCYPDSAAGTA